MDSLSALTVSKLKDKCRELGIPVGGRKADLITRIQDELASLKAAPDSPLPTQTSKATTKRKAPPENASSAREDSVGKKKKGSDVPQVVVIFPVANQLAASRQETSDATAPQITRCKERSVNAKDSRFPSDVATMSTLRPLSIPNPTVRYPQMDIATVQLSSQAPWNPDPDPNHCSHFSKSTRYPRIDPLLLPRADSPPIKQSDRNVRLEVNALRLNASDPRRISISKVRGPVLPQPQAPAQMGVTFPPLKEQPFKQVQQSLDNLVSANLAVSGEGADPSMVEAKAPRFKGLKPDMDRRPPILQLVGSPQIFSSSSRTAEREPASKTIRPLPTPNIAVSLPPPNMPHKKDHEISPSVIRNPPRYSLRRQVEKIARVLALTSFYGFPPCAHGSVPGDFLKSFAGLSRNYRYASTLAFTHLIRIEFPGNRTERWFKVKRIDEKVADTRSWYWHRVSDRARAIERLRTSWMERVWRFLVVASRPAVADVGPWGFGLWFGGIGRHLLADPDLEGQFETAMRFWIRRFYVWVTKNGGGYPRLLHDLREEMVQEIQPLDENGNQELWRVETRCGSVHFIIGTTGEVVGWVEVNGVGSNGLESVQQRRSKTRINTIMWARTTAKTIGGGEYAGLSQANGRKYGNMDNVSWKDLRGDWREHASTLVSSISSTGGIDVPTRRLLETVYSPASKTISHGIHESIKAPHHRVLAERWILAQVEPGGISGKPVLDALYGQPRKKEKITLDLQAELTVESVRCSGEKWLSTMKGVLAQGLGFVQTPGMGWFVLEETGQNIAQEEYGIQGLWATVLGVNENGIALNARELEALVEMFYWGDMLD